MYVPGLVNVYITNWKITMLSMGKSTISTGSFSSSQTVFTFTRPGRGYFDDHPLWRSVFVGSRVYKQRWRGLKICNIQTAVPSIRFLDCIT